MTIRQLAEQSRAIRSAAVSRYVQREVERRREACSECGSTRAETVGFVNAPGRVCVNVAQCDRRRRDRAIAAAMIERHEQDNSAA